MLQRKRLHRVPRFAALAVACAAAIAVGVAGPRAAQRNEVRALWVLRTSLSSRAAIAAMVGQAKEHGFNTLLVQVRSRGDAYFNDAIEPRAAPLARQSGSFDPLEETLTLAHDAGLRVHAWVNLNLVSSAAELPIARDHLVYRHPEWLMVPRRLVPQLEAISIESPEYLGKIARWSRTESGTIEGLYVSPIPPAAADHTVAVVADLVKRYRVDGVHLDYARYPTDEFDYSRASLALFRAEMLPGLAPGERRDLDARLAVDPTAYPDAYPERWREFREARLAALVRRVRAGVKSVRPEALLSAAVIPDPATAETRHFQDWRSWLENGLIDVVCPMAYTQDAAAFRTQIEAARDAAGPRAVWAGIGAYRLTSAQTVENIRSARRAGVDGIVLFSYDSLVTPTAGADYLAQVARAAFAANDQ